MISMYSAYASEGIHVGSVIIDGVIDSPATRRWGSRVQLMDTLELADSFYGLHTQPKSVWSYEIQVGPNTGSVGMRL